MCNYLCIKSLLQQLYNLNFLYLLDVMDVNLQQEIRRHMTLNS